MGSLFKTQKPPKPSPDPASTPTEIQDASRRGFLSQERARRGRAWTMKTDLNSRTGFGFLSGQYGNRKSTTG